MVMRLLLLVFLVGVLLLSGCAAIKVGPISKAEAFPAMYSENPVSILVVPAINKSTAADAPILYSSTINEPLSNAGFYVLPIEVTTRMLQNEGLTEGEQIIEVPPQKFAEFFGADAVFYATIEKWDTNYFVLGGNVTVAIDYKLISTKTGETLWKFKDQLVIDTSGDSNNSGGLLGALIATAIATAVQDYVPVARNVNIMALNAIPFGKYHNLHKNDMETKIPRSKIR